MKSILKYSKGKGNTYIVHLDDENITLYDDLVIKYGLLLKKMIDDKELELIKKEQLELESYYVALKYLNVKMRSKKEVREYLKRKNYSSEAINETISKLLKQGYLNDLEYAKCFIHDKFVLSSMGPVKVKSELEKMGINDDSDSLDSYDWASKLERLVSKKVKTFKSDSASTIRIKMQKYFVNLGYPLGMVIDSIEKIKIEENEDGIYKEALKFKKKLMRKYDGNELERQVRNKLYQKGYMVDNIDKIMCKVFDN